MRARRWQGGAILAIAMGASVAARQAEAACTTASQITAGRLFNSGKLVLGATAETPFTFSGDISVPYNAGDSQRIEVQVLKTPGAEQATASNWVSKGYVNLATTQGFKAWSIALAPFDAANFPNGNIARIRAVWKNACTTTTKVLTTHDSFGYALPPVPSVGSAGAIWTDVDRNPFDLSDGPPYLSIKGSLFPPVKDEDPAIRAGKVAAETRAYYDTVRTRADGTGTTAESITGALGDLAKFRARYFTGKTEYVTKYYNKGDLGIGREMHCAFAPTSSGEHACYVFNYAPIVGDIPQFGNQSGSLTAQFTNKDVPFAAVAMVERGAMSPTADNRMFFAVYNCVKKLGELLPAFRARCLNNTENKLYGGEVQLDSTAYNTFNPGNCLNCHGVEARYDQAKHSVGPKVAGGTGGAFFLPFDLDAFAFPTDPLYTRAAQHNTFRAMNEQIYWTAFRTNGGAKLVRGWYDGDWVNGQFNGDRVESTSDWGTTDSANRIYRQTYSNYCRTCHVSAKSDALSFATFAAFKNKASMLKAFACDTLVMPHAQQTMKASWPTDARATMLGHLGITGKCGR